MLFAFVAVDAVGAAIVYQLLGLTWLGLVLAAAAVAIAIFGYRESRPAWLRAAALGLLVLLLLLLPQLILIARQPPHAALIDGVLLNDAAADRLLSGHDPYVGDYLNTPMRSFYLSDVPVNFGLIRFVYMPGMALVDVPLRLLHSDRANFSWLFLPGLVGLGAAAWSIGRRRIESEAALIAVVLSPLFQLDYLYLLNDLFFLAPALAGVGLLRRGRPAAAGVMFGLSLAMKQHAVLFLPLVAYYAWTRLERRDLARLVAGASAAAGLLILPFILWDARAFVAGTAAFFYGSGVDSYPVRGIGLQGLLLQAGYITNRWEAFPSAQLQLPILVVALTLAVLDLRRAWRWSHFWAWMGVEAIVVFAFGRVLSPNYLDLVATFLFLALVSAMVGEMPGSAVPGEVDGAAGGGGPVELLAESDPGHLPSV